MQIELRHVGEIVWLVPEGWVDPATPVRVVSVPVAGGQLAFDPASPRPSLPMGLITSLSQASWWIASVYGDGVLQAALDGETTAAAVPGDAAMPLTRMAHAVWLQRWWHPAATDVVDFDLLAAEVGALQVEAAVCFEDDDLALAELTTGMDAILRLPKTITGLVGAKRERLDAGLASLVEAANWYADRDHPSYPQLGALAAHVAEECALTSDFLAELDAFLGQPHRELALHAGGMPSDFDETSLSTVDWLLVPSRSTNGDEDNVLIGIGEGVLQIRVKAGLEPVERLAALVYLRDYLPKRIVQLDRDGGQYLGSTDWDDCLPDSVVITRVPLLDGDSYAPRDDEAARSDRDFVRTVVADRLSNLTDTSLICEELA